MTFENLLTKVLSDKKTTIDWLMAQGVIASSMRCPHEGCDKMMELKEEKSEKGSSDGYIWCCRSTVYGQSRHQLYRSVRSNSWFAKSNLTLAEILKVTYYWSHSYSQVQTQHEFGISSATCVDWYMFAREVCEEDIIRNSQPIGGPDIRVQIDETKVGKLKFNRGHRVNGQWVFGGREEFDRTKIFMVCVELSNSDTLLPIIQKWILPGSVIISDYWKASMTVSLTMTTSTSK
jgi:hypothetical protein